MTEEIKRGAYLKGLKLKNTGLDEESIYAHLEKQGFNEDPAKEVAKNVCLQREEDAINNAPAPGFYRARGGGLSVLISEFKFC